MQSEELIVTQDTIMSKYPSLLTLDKKTLKTLSIIPQNSTSIPLEVVIYKNYLVSYGLGDS